MSRRVARAIQATVLSVFTVAIIAAAIAHSTEQQTATETRVEQPQRPTYDGEIAARWPGCIAEPDWIDGQPAATVIVQDFWRPDGAVRPMPFDLVWAENHDDDRRAWHVVALCGGETHG